MEVFVYLWNIKKLKQSIVENGIAEKDIFKIIFLMTCVVFVVMFLKYINYIDICFLIYPQSFISLAIYLFCIYLCFKQNQRGDNCQFLEKFTVLSLVVVLRLSVIYVPIFIVINFLLPSFFYSDFLTKNKEYMVYIIDGIRGLNFLIIMNLHFKSFYKDNNLKSQQYSLSTMQN
jgi:hypothetical protein